MRRWYIERTNRSVYHERSAFALVRGAALGIVPEGRRWLLPQRVVQEHPDTASRCDAFGPFCRGLIAPFVV
jgi:hypothetical protein